MALLKEIWIQDIQEQLAESHGFLRFATDHASFIHQNLVHVPQAGAIPVSTKSRTGGPATVLTRTDTDLTYPINSRSTDPVLISDLATTQLSYDKRRSLMQAHTDRLLEDMARDVLFAWAPSAASQIVRTGGAASALSLAQGATGTRKAATIKDIARLAQRFDMDAVPMEDRYLCLPPALYYELFEADTVLSRQTMGYLTLPAGVLREAYGFQVLVSNALPLYAADLSVKELTDAPAATDNLCGLAWQKACVAHALGKVDVYQATEDPVYYGGLLSAKAFGGAAKIRADQKGVAALVQL